MEFRIEDELETNFTLSVAKQDQRREIIFRKIAKKIYKKAYFCSLTLYKDSVDQGKFFSLGLKFWHTDVPKRKIGNLLVKDTKERLSNAFAMENNPYYWILKRTSSEREFFLKVLWESFASKSTLPDFGGGRSMSWYDFHKFSDSIWLVDKIVDEKKKFLGKGRRTDFRREIGNQFFKICDTKRVFVDRKVVDKSLKGVEKSASHREVGLSFPGFNKFLCYLEKFKGAAGDFDFKHSGGDTQPGAGFVLLLFEMSTAGMKDLSGIISGYDFESKLVEDSSGGNLGVRKSMITDRKELNKNIYNSIFGEDQKLSSFSNAVSGNQSKLANLGIPMMAASRTPNSGPARKIGRANRGSHMFQNQKNDTRKFVRDSDFENLLMDGASSDNQTVFSEDNVD